ncbi:MAG: type III secretion inner membrane ring lipoprotein SctJ [Gammaproteobacteria bacterium]|nr:type III secretion inner membrane ring lipoprotein SctJ [Gammaproteobacteria bacterium]
MLLLAGCGKVPLYNSLTEQESNEMMALLLENGIETDKTAAKEGIILSVPKSQVPLAVNLLHAHGYPWERYTNVNEVFGDTGLVTTDFERKVRFNFAVSQEISESLSKIDGVMFVKVHLSMMGADAGGNKAGPGRARTPDKLSAAVFIKYNPEYNLDSEIPKIRQLVSGGINNLAYQDVSVTLSPAAGRSPVEVFATDGLRTVRGVNLKIEAASIGRFYALVGIIVALVAALAACVVVLLRRQTRQ